MPGKSEKNKMKYYLGIDVGGTSVKCGVVSADGVILAKDSFPTPPRAEDIPAQAAALCRTLLDGCGMAECDITAVGVGLPGTVDAKAGVVRYANNIHMRDLPFVRLFREQTDLPTYIGNDANAAALGEVCFGAARGLSSAVLVTLGTGVGTGIVIDGRLLEGEGGAGAEGGHICLVYNGEKCSCGRRGCYEAYASATALKRQTAAAAEAHPESLLAAEVAQNGVSGKTAFACARAGDAVAQRVTEQYLSYVAAGITDLVNLFRPQIVLIGGGISNEKASCCETVSDIVNRESYGSEIHTTPLPVRPAALRNDAGILGAAAIAIFAAEKEQGR